MSDIENDLFNNSDEDGSDEESVAESEVDYDEEAPDVTKPKLIIGDDVVDLPIMRQVGFSIAVANAVTHIKSHADWTTVLAGGNGGLREACDFILATQNKTAEAIERYIHS